LQIFYTDTFDIPLPPGHRFPLAKYAMLRSRLDSSALLPKGTLRVPSAATVEQLSRVHESEYIARVMEGRLSVADVRRIGLPWSAELVERARRSVGATIEACRAALSEGHAVSLAGGTHHAHADLGEGYCVFNDAAVAARAMQVEGGIRRIIVVDCDVHQGNGTAAIFHSDPSVFTFGIYGARNFPFSKECCDMDIPLPDGTGDDEYISALASGLSRALSAARPELAIYLAGADPYSGDSLGRLALSKTGLLERDRLVLRLLGEARIPVAVTMAGGYAADINDTVDVHFATVKAVLEHALAT
jgi:acetoin utilization deacetylase AcuC-like enzyme